MKFKYEIKQDYNNIYLVIKEETGRVDKFEDFIFMKDNIESVFNQLAKYVCNYYKPRYLNQLYAHVQRNKKELQEAFNYLMTMNNLPIDTILDYKESECIFVPQLINPFIIDIKSDYIYLNVVITDYIYKFSNGKLQIDLGTEDRRCLTSKKQYEFLNIPSSWFELIIKEQYEFDINNFQSQIFKNNDKLFYTEYRKSNQYERKFTNYTLDYFTIQDNDISESFKDFPYIISKHIAELDKIFDFINGQIT